MLSPFLFDGYLLYNYFPALFFTNNSQDSPDNETLYLSCCNCFIDNRLQKSDGLYNTFLSTRRFPQRLKALRFLRLVIFNIFAGNTTVVLESVYGMSFKCDTFKIFFCHSSQSPLTQQFLTLCPSWPGRGHGRHDKDHGDDG